MYLRIDLMCITNLFRDAGTILNFRRRRPGARFHAAINSVVKLLNCVGFGIPSVSNDKPAYRELAPTCTLFSSDAESFDMIRDLYADKYMWNDMRHACLAIADRFSIETVAERYQAVICAECGLDDSSVITRQMTRYRRARLAEESGLAEPCIVARRHTLRTETLRQHLVCRVV